MSDAYRVELSTVDGGPTALGRSGTLTVVVDRPVAGGGRGLGFNGGQLLNMAVAGCISNDLYREAAARGITLTRVRLSVDSDYGGPGDPSSPIEYDVEVEGEADEAALADLVRHVDEIAEIPSSLRHGTPVTLRRSSPSVQPRDA